MHILIGLLGTIVSLLYLLDRVGIDLGWINPWSWRRRRNWRNQFQGDPIYAIEDPVQIAALFVVGVARLDGDLSAEQKKATLGLFEEKFSLDARGASQLYAASVHLLAAPQLLESQLEGLAKRAAPTFSTEQAESLGEMIDTIVAMDGDPSDAQRRVTDGLLAGGAKARPQGTWA
ncbi:MAG TPA: hypothetical protein PKK10_09005 [Woeseiaceae bacterium]|nr:hypothetical protein [Woeseiaceae bacterium]